MDATAVDILFWGVWRDFGNGYRGRKMCNLGRIADKTGGVRDGLVNLQWSSVA